MWGPLGATALGLYLEKLAGYLLPASVLEQASVRRIAALLPIALLAAIVAVQTVGSGRGVALDARIPGLAVAVVLLSRRANFLVTVVGAAATTAIVRHLGWMS